MPFTPLHIGPGLFIKSLMQGSFSLMIFSWAQIIMDIQPLLVMISGRGHLHGFTHTFMGAILIAVFAALSGKTLSEFFLDRAFKNVKRTTIGWKVVFSSAFIGSFSHVLLDGIMHLDVEPFYPFNSGNKLLGLISMDALHILCLCSGVIGGVLYMYIIRVNEK